MKQSRWEAKKKELERKFWLRTLVLDAVNIAIICGAIFCCNAGCNMTKARDAKEHYKCVQEIKQNSGINMQTKQK